MNEGRFTEDDLVPSDEEKQAARRRSSIASRRAWPCSPRRLGRRHGRARRVRRAVRLPLTPAPFSGDAMGAAFARFDQSRSARRSSCSAPRSRAPGPPGRAAHASPRASGGCSRCYGRRRGLHRASCSPRRSCELHRSGAQRGAAPAGDELEQIHKRAEAVGKVRGRLRRRARGAPRLHPSARGRPEDDETTSPSRRLPPGPPRSRRRDGARRQALQRLRAPRLHPHVLVEDAANRARLVELCAGPWQGDEVVPNTWEMSNTLSPDEMEDAIFELLGERDRAAYYYVADDKRLFRMVLG